jgi:hypothetical protein
VRSSSFGSAVNGTDMIKGSLVVGLGVLAACAFSFFGTATFVGSFLARKEKALPP